MVKPDDEVTGEELLTFDLKGLYRREVWEQGGAVIRVLKPKAGGETVYAAQGIFVPRDNRGNQVGPPATFWFRIPHAANIEDAFKHGGEYLKPAGEAYLKRLNDAMKAERGKIIAATDQPQFRRGAGSGGDGGGPRIVQ